MTLSDSVTVVTEPAREQLDQKQLVDYRSKGEGGLSWRLAFGRSYAEADNYTPGTVEPRAYHIDQFYR